MSDRPGHPQGPDRRDPRDECRAIHDLLIHHRRGELGASDAGRVREHLEACADCRRFDEVEASLDRLIAGALAAGPAPSGLAERVRARLDEAEGPLSASRGLPGWGWALAAAASLIVGLFLPNPARLLGPGEAAAEGRADAGHLRPAPEAVEAELSGVLVDDECDRAGMPLEYQKDCDHPSHHTVLKTDRGEYVALVAHAGQPSLDRSQRGRRVRARGVYLASTGTLDLASLIFQ
jgi:hypothetical protein